MVLIQPISVKLGFYFGYYIIILLYYYITPIHKSRQHIQLPFLTPLNALLTEIIVLELNRKLSETRQNKCLLF